MQTMMQMAHQKVEEAKGKPSTIEQRTHAAIELAGWMLQEAHQTQKREERKQQEQLARLMQDPKGKVFTTALTDQCFRSQNPYRVADQIVYVMHKYGIPQYLSLSKKIGLGLFKWLGKPFAPLTVPLTVQMLRKETAAVILPSEPRQLAQHMERRQKEGVRINLNHLGEAILGEEEAHHRLQVYVDDLAKPNIEYISVKISTLYSQLNLLAWEETLDTLADRLRQLYRAAMQNGARFVNLDMEEYRDLQLTVALFRKVLDEPEFHQHAAGIVLQSYLPDAFAIQQELTQWAMQRVKQGGAPIKIRIVKGANLAMEKIEAALRLWPQAPYLTKEEVDANYKRMVNFGCQPEYAKAVHLGIASHNLFDIAYAMLLRAENRVEKEVGFEMLEGMAEPMRRVVQQLSGDMLLYCPVVAKEDFQNAMAYLVRRLDENTAPENFLRHAFDLSIGTPEWERQTKAFEKASLSCDEVSAVPRRSQDRRQESVEMPDTTVFQNEPDTDWSLAQNRQWDKAILSEWSQKKMDPIPLQIGGEFLFGRTAQAEDPSKPGQPLYTYTLATSEQVDRALEIAKTEQQRWNATSALLKKIAEGFRRHRADLIGAMVADTGKTISEADIEVSEAVDFAEYYRRIFEEVSSLKDVEGQAKGTILVAPPWNFPCSIPAGGVLGALVTGNCVILKPAPESVLVGWQVAQVFWEAGVSPRVLQFITCEDDPVGSQLIQDPRLDAVILTGATATAKLFLRLRPDLDLIAETGGKNTMVITAMADRDLAIKDLVHSAFSHAGQKCSATSLAILEAEVYDSPTFRKQLRDAVASLSVGSAWNPKTKVNPLIRQPNPTLLKGLTTLEEGEEWLLEPKQDAQNPQLWSPGIKMGVKPGSFTFQNELFGPVLGVVRADNFEHALTLMNQTPYGLTAGLHTLDEREQHAWLQRIEAGNCYINRTTTGAIVQRQPFGGHKESSFGRGSKAGGPNYLTQFMRFKQKTLPRYNIEINSQVTALTAQIASSDLEVWQASIESYAFYWTHYFSQKHDPSQVLGQDNVQCYTPHPQMVFRIQEGDSALDSWRVSAAALTCGTPLEVSRESEEEFIKRVEQGQIKRVRLLKPASKKLQEALARAGCRLNVGPVLANGRLELLNYLREMSISHDYHRYGNLGDRENG